MSIEAIPPGFIYTCDVCGKTHEQRNATGHYTNSRPPHWMSLHIGAHAYDFQGQAVADNSVKRLLCDECGPSIAEAVVAQTKIIRARKKAGDGP